MTTCFVLPFFVNQKQQFMAKKKKVMEYLDDEEIELLNRKMSPSQQKTETFKSLFDSYKVQLKCKNVKQKELHNLITTKELVFCHGEAGTGKSYIAAATALELLKSGPYTNIILCCPNVESSSMPLGYLPGTTEQKIQPYLDAMEFTLEKILNESGNFCSREIIKKFKSNEIIREEAISFLRGKTFDNSIVIIDEAENLNKQEVLLILTRIGRNSKMIFLGDKKQLDRRDIKKSGEKCGLEHAFDVLQDLEEVGFVHFTEEDIVRNPIISKILKKWNGIDDTSQEDTKN